MLKKISVFVLLCFQISLYSQTKLASFFSDHMVLQQNEKVTLWGKDKPKKKLKIEASWGESLSAKTDADGNWSVKIETPKAGGPYSIKIQGSDKITLNDILIGEVWLCSGQSNMEMPVKGLLNQPINGSQETILNGNNNKLRVFTVEKNSSLEPLEDVVGDWQIASPKTVGNFSATAYFFGNKICNSLQIPVGLIVTSWGGSRAEAWTDSATLKEFKESIIIPKEKPKTKVNQVPTLLYNAMIHPLIGYTIKGTIWYQGESNRLDYKEYPQLITSMVESWRTQWNQPEFPFYYVQIAPFNYKKDGTSAFLREAQLKTMSTLKNCGMAVTLDIGEATSIHPMEKRKVGERLAYWALAKDYNIAGIEYIGPTYKEMTVVEDNVLIVFDNVPNGISSFGKKVIGFEIAGEDKIFHPATAKIVHKKRAVSVKSDKVKKPIAVRYNFHDFVEASLFSSSGLPASSFRTDSWTK